MRVRLCVIASAIIIFIVVYGRKYTGNANSRPVNVGQYVADRLPKSQKFRTTVEFRELGASTGTSDIITAQFTSGAKDNDVAAQLAIASLSPTVKNAISDAGLFLPLSQTAGNAIDVSGPLLPELQTDGTVTRFKISAKPMGRGDPNYAIWDTIQGIHGQHFTPPAGEQCRSRLPGCIILGDFKAGTRELIDFMAMHPNVVIKRDPIYEISFFANDDKYNLGLDWYRSAMPCSYSNQLTVEKSPSYFESVLAPQRIHKMNPDIKLIVLLREPVSATLSHCTHHDDTCNMRKIFADYPNNTRVHTDNLVKYRLYDEALSRYYAVFNRSQLLVINHKNFIRNPYLVLKRVENFLELQPRIKAENFALHEEKGFFCVTPGNTTTATCFHEKRGRSAHSTENTNTIANLKEFFRPHNERLFQLLGYKIDWG